MSDCIKWMLISKCLYYHISSFVKHSFSTSKTMFSISIETFEIPNLQIQKKTLVDEGNHREYTGEPQLWIL